MSTFPSVLTTYTNPLSTDRLNSPSHSGIETNQNSGLSQVEAVIGVEGASSVVGSLQYFIKSPDSDGGGHIQTANKGGTGQTSYTKGDILVASSSSVLSKLSVSSTDGYALVSDSTQATGMKWGLPGNTPTIRTYSSVVSIWYRPSVLSYITVELVGGGGNGANGVDGGANNTAGGGGGAGGYSRKTIPFASLPIAASVFAGPSSVMSYFGSIMSAQGGSPASGAIYGAGGTATGGDLNIIGGYGAPSAGAGSATTAGGNGGASFFGGGGAGGTDSGDGAAGQVPGSGGGGGGGDGSRPGGAGAMGIVIVTEY